MGFTVLPEERSFGTEMARGLGQGFGQTLPRFADHIMQGRLTKKENEALMRLTGVDFSGLSPDMKKLAFSQLSQRQGESPENSSMLIADSALTALERMISKPGIGMLGKLNPTGTARRNRGEFEATQAAVLPLFKSMFPRGMTEKEFKYINDTYIPQAGDTEEKIKGKIKGLRQLMQTKMGAQIPSQDSPDQQTNKQRKPLSAFGK